MDYREFTEAYTSLCKNRLDNIYLPAMNRRTIYYRLINYLVELAAERDEEIHSLELIEREPWDYVLHVNDSIAIHCPVLEWQKEKEGGVD